MAYFAEPSTPAAPDGSSASPLTRTLRGVSNALWYLDTPAAIVRNAVDYGMDGTFENPFDPATRHSADDLVEKSTGITNPVGRFALGTVASVALDPLTYLSGPLKALTPGGRAAAATGLIDDAAEVASKSLQQRLIAAGTKTEDVTGRAGRALRRLGRGVDDYAEHAADPLVGTRAAQRATNLEDLIQNRTAQGKWGADQQRHLDGFLNTNNLSYDDIKSTPLSRSLGLGSLVGDPLGAAAGDVAARVLDRIPETVRWSPVGLAAHQFANKAVGKLYEPIGQSTVTQINNAGQDGVARGGRAAGEVAQQLQFAKIPDDVARRTGLSDPKDVRVQEALDRYIEGVAVTAKDVDLIENTPKLKAIADDWARNKVSILQESKDAGINAHLLKHRYGAEYRPYSLTTALDRTVLNKNGNPAGAYFDLITGDQIARKKSLQLPGAIDQLRFYAKRPEFLMGRKDAAGKLWSRDEVAAQLFKEINDPNSAYYQTVQGSKAHQTAIELAAKTKGTPKYGQRRAAALADFLGDLDPADPVAFGNHPAEAIARYTTGRYAAIATGEALGDAITSRAVRQVAGAAKGEKMVPLAKALSMVGLKSGKAKTPLVNAGAVGAQARALAKLGVNDLSGYSVPQSFIDRLTDAENLVKSPAAQGAAGKFLAEHMRAFKSQVLAWPSRVTRDWASGTIGNFLTVKDPVALSKSMYHTQSLLNGSYDEALPYIKSLPAYAQMATGGKGDEEILQAYLNDLAESGTLKGMGMVEREIGDRTGKSLLEVLPGSTPMPLPIPNAQTVKDIVTDKNSLDWYGIKGVSFGNRQRSWTQFGKDWVADPVGSGSNVQRPVRKVTNNPFFRKAEQASEWSDAHARLSGYNALLAEGVAPREAARRLKRIHVDYESLTDFEKGIRNLWAPFYSYNARSGQFAIEELMNPGGAYRHALQTRERLQNSDENAQYLPQSYREKGGFTVNPETLRSLGVPDAMNIGLAPEGMSTVLGGIDIPGASFLDSFAYKPSANGALDSAAASAGATLRNFSAQAAPPLRVFTEMATGKDAFTRRDVGYSQSQWDKAIGGVINLAGGDGKSFRLKEPVKWAADLLIPGASRITGFVGTALDPNVDRASGALGAVWNSVAPVRHYYVSDEQRTRDERAAIDEMLQRVPGRRTFSTTSIPEEVAEGLPPQFQALLARKKVLDKESRAASKAESTTERRAAKFRATRSERKARSG
jgi:hypothetical protein